MAEAGRERDVDGTVRRVVVVGGGTAGWLVACRLAAAADRGAARPLTVTLVESPDIPTIGVGEGTWPTMRRTLEAIGLAEADFLLACDASFKQGSRFLGWRTGAADDAYLHPFTPPPPGEARDILAAWDRRGAFADAVAMQAQPCARDLAPRQRAMPDYAGALNYAYHLDAGRFAQLLARHGVERLGVRHRRATVTGVEADDTGDIAAVLTREQGQVDGDLFIDCTGHAALLIGGHAGVPLVDRTDVLFNDRALAVQVPVEPGSAIRSQTDATAHAAGWIWDIGLPTRRGVGCVYSSAHLDDDAAAATLRAYLRRTTPGLVADPTPRRLAFRSAHRERFWQGNCVAIGLSAGFLEPLEASAIVMIELSIDALLAGFPTRRDVMPVLARRFDALFRYRWDRVIEFLKLHYVLSDRDEPYWRDHRRAETVPPRLADLLALWRDQPPSGADLPQADEVFPAASYQYVLYGMGFPPPPAGPLRGDGGALAVRLDQQRARTRGLLAGLPTNRAYLDGLAAVSSVAAERLS